MKLNKTPVLESTCTTLPIGRTKYIKNTGYNGYNDTTAVKRHEVNHCARYSSVVIYLFIHHLYPELCVVGVPEHFTHTRCCALLYSGQTLCDLWAPPTGDYWELQYKLNGWRPPSTPQAPSELPENVSTIFHCLYFILEISFSRLDSRPMCRRPGQKQLDK